METTHQIGVRAMFEQDVPAGFLDDWLRRLVSCFKAAKDLEDRFSPEQAHDAIPHVRHGFVQDELYNLVRLHGGSPSRMPNAAENCSHTEGVFNGRTLLTAHAVRKPQEGPRVAIFRNRLAREVFQYSLPFDGKPSIPEEGPSIGVYAQLLFGPPDRRTGFPGFARVAFPHVDGVEVDSIDLTMRLSELFYRQRREEVIADELQFGLVFDAVKKEEDTA